MGQGCSSSSCYAIDGRDRESSSRRGKNRYNHSGSIVNRNGAPHDPVMYDLIRKSTTNNGKGQSHLLYKNHKHHQQHSSMLQANEEEENELPNVLTRLVIRRRGNNNNNSASPPSSSNNNDETNALPVSPPANGGGTHIYAVRCPPDDLQEERRPEQRPEQRPSMKQPPVVVTPSKKKKPSANDQDVEVSSSSNTHGDIYTPQAMAAMQHTATIVDLVTISSEHHIYVCDTGLTSSQCDEIIWQTEQACRGHYAAYTYAKQTLGCREFASLAKACFGPVQTVASTILDFSQNTRLVLDDREPHMVKYDVTKKERQKLDMHTDKSEWTFLISLSDGCGLDYDGGGTYFECLDATVHVQRGHALVFPGKLRHCGQKITKGLRFLLVGFLVDKTQPPPPQAAVASNTTITITTPSSSTTQQQQQAPQAAMSQTQQQQPQQ